MGKAILTPPETSIGETLSFQPSSLRDDVYAICQKQMCVLFEERMSDLKEIGTILDRLQEELYETIRQTDIVSEQFQAFVRYKAACSKEVTAYLNAVICQNDASYFEDFRSTIRKFISELPKTFVEEQDASRFLRQPADSFGLRIRKGWKRNFYTISQFPKKSKNRIRRLRKKPEQPHQYWTHEVELQNIASAYFEGFWFKNIIPVIDQLHQLTTEALGIYWKIDVVVNSKMLSLLHPQEDAVDWVWPVAEVDQSSLTDASFYTRWKTAFDEHFQNTYTAFQQSLEKCDTIELPRSRYSDSATKQKIVTAQKAFYQYLEKWNTTLKLFRDDWDIDLEFYGLAFQIYIEKAQITKRLEKQVDSIRQEIDKLVAFQNKSQDRIQKTSTENLKSLLEREIRLVQTTYGTALIPEVSQAIASNGPMRILDVFIKRLDRQLHNLSTERYVSTDEDYSLPTPINVAHKIAPRELIVYESWPRLSRDLDKVKATLLSQFNTLVEHVLDTANISAFTLDTALTLLENSSAEEDPRNTAAEGIQRNITKLQEVQENAAGLLDQFDTLTAEPVAQFTNDLIDFTSNENILNIRLAIAKAKSIERGKALRKKVVDYVVQFVPKAQKVLYYNYKRVRTVAKPWLSWLGLEEEISQQDRATSGFLVEADKNVEQLPFVYQRLFRSESLQNESFFVGLQLPLSKLATLYEDWFKGRFAPTLLTGERGSGKTALAQSFFTDKSHVRTKVICCEHTYGTAQEFIQLLNDTLETSWQTVDECAAGLLQGRKKVLIIEDAHNLYLRKVGGTEPLQALLDLIAATYTHVFWIVTISQYAFGYLNKTIGLAQDFASIINIEENYATEVTQALLQRHKVSGYKLHFIEPPKAMLPKKYSKLNDQEKQQYLQDEFFGDISRIAKGNFRIAYTYWLSAAVKVVENTIHIRSLKNINWSFIENLPASYYFVLNTILLHERLTIAQICTVSHLDATEVIRIVNSLYHKGLLTYTDSNYMLNILVYRQVSNYLKSKNIVH